ncbi:PAS domain S-box-containing protein/diguanylate cyclase (GGDEF)-like protein [Pseudomonas duriflava]|uniref:PAS domain S-box-containing protein/diguanylate cyclase (GGDEF)-like protein n=1 Tax=Pseudomonas duriflava TaxID=459528 RepID=A0A562QIH4_9PSED|nr:sensor domain-containing diguanylate cyclase [Pseudomonas duriflava]TWI56539.1 PAS domain S-box-containing protein/diguanylate cyclase (GGDEF)-like protein [Pseudomonas duriflava]
MFPDYPHDPNNPELQLRALIDSVQEFIVLKDGQGRWLIINKAVVDAHELNGVDYVGKTDGELVLIRPKYKKAFDYNTHTDELAWQNGTALRIEKSFIGPDGRINTWEVVKIPHFDSEGNRHRLVIVSRNITERKLAEAALQASEQKYRLITENMSDLIGVTGPDGIVRYVSPSCLPVLGYSPEEIQGHLMLELVHPDDRDRVLATFHQLLNREITQRKAELRCRQVTGEYVWLEANVTRIESEGGNALEGIVFACRDISQRKQYELRLQAMAHLDPLTGIPNRRVLMDDMQREIEQLNATSFAVLYLDLDRFKTINDQQGHETGDELLIQFVLRIQEYLRTSDLFARIGGDEFVIVLPGADETQALRIAQRLCQVLQEPWELANGALQTTSSIGVALYPEAGDSVHLLLRHADEALYQAKRAGRACVRLFKTPA